MNAKIAHICILLIAFILFSHWAVFIYYLCVYNVKNKSLFSVVYAYLTYHADSVYCRAQWFSPLNQISCLHRWLDTQHISLELSTFVSSFWVWGRYEKAFRLISSSGLDHNLHWSRIRNKSISGHWNSSPRLKNSYFMQGKCSTKQL